MHVHSFKNNITTGTDGQTGIELIMLRAPLASCTAVYCNRSCGWVGGWVSMWLLPQ